MAAPFYYGTVRRTIAAFGSMFSEIYIQRRQGDSVEGDVVQTLHVPLAYAPKEKWLLRLQQEPSLENVTYTSLPRMNFEITGYSYDSARKLQRMGAIQCGAGTPELQYVRTPVPYNMDINLYVISKNQEDGIQIIEQILPVFTPEYTLSLKALPQMNVIQDVPIVLNSVGLEDDYSGDFKAPRFVIHTLGFTLKLNLFGRVSDQGVISDVRVGLEPAAYHLVGDVDTGEVTSEEWLEDF